MLYNVFPHEVLATGIKHISCSSSVRDIVKTFLANTPSYFEKINCKNATCTNIQKNFSMIETICDDLDGNDIGNLETSVMKIMNQEAKCEMCSSICNAQRSIGNQLIIEVIVLIECLMFL